MAHPFMNTGGTIPKTLPLSTFDFPPQQQFQPSNNTDNLKMSQNDMPQGLTEISPNHQKNVDRPANDSQE